MAEHTKRIAKRLSAKVVAEVPNTGGGAFGASRLAEIDAALQARLSALAGSQLEAHPARQGVRGPLPTDGEPLECVTAEAGFGPMLMEPHPTKRFTWAKDGHAITFAPEVVEPSSSVWKADTLWQLVVIFHARPTCAATRIHPTDFQIGGYGNAKFTPFLVSCLHGE